jgi:hypothetical protein
MIIGMNNENQGQSAVATLKLSISKSALWACLSLVLFRVVLDLGYIVLCRDWGYLGFVLDFNALKLFESYVLLFVILLFIPKSSQKLSHLMTWILILLSYIPMLTFFVFHDEARLFMYAVTGFWLVVFFLLRAPGIHIPSLKHSGILLYGLFICLAGSIFFLIYKYLGLSLKFGLREVYDIRAEQPVTQIPFGGYLLAGLAKVANPLLFIMFILKRKWLFSALIVVLQILLFSATGNRSYFFTLPFVLVISWIITRRNPLAYLGAGLTIVVLGSILAYLIADNSWGLSLFVRRTLLSPANLSFLYYDFFSQTPPVLLSHSILGGVTTYPYQLSPPNLIGDVYFNNPTLNANTGVVGDAFMNFRFIGLALWAVILVIILKIVDGCSRGADYRIGAAVIAMPAMSLVNTALLTNILSHGLLWALIFLYLLPKRKKLLNEPP